MAVLHRLELRATPVRLGAELDRARQRNLAWMVDHGLLRTAQERNQYDSWALPDLIGYSFPDARGASLQLLVDMLGWFTAIDDHFDGPPGKSPAAAEAVVAPLLAIMRSDVPGSALAQRETGLTGAWRDLWHRQCCGAPQAWLARAAMDWEACLRTFITEAAHRHDRASPSLQEGVLLRRHASCLYPFMNMLERAEGSVVPPALIGDEAHERLRANTADVATYVNDLFSLEREERQGEIHNMVMILRRLKGVSRDEAIQEVSSRIHQLMDECEHLTARIAEAHPAARGYLQGMRALINGVYRWSSTTRRYEEGPCSPPMSQARDALGSAGANGA